MEVEPLEESGSERLLPKRKSRPGIFFGAAGYLSEGMPVILSEFLLDEQDPMFARMAGEIIKQGGKPEIEAHCQYGNRMYFNQAHGVLIVAMVREVEQFPESRVVAYLHAVREAFVVAGGRAAG